jgi:hypothetical protein
VLHGEVHGALEALDAGVDHLPGQPRERLLDVQIEVRVVQIVVPQTFESSQIHTSPSDRRFRAENGNNNRTTKNQIREWFTHRIS